MSRKVCLTNWQDTDSQADSAKCELVREPMTIWSLVSRIEFLILFRDEKFSFMIDDTCFRILFKIVRGNRELQLDYYVKRLTIHVRNKDFRKSEDSRRESFRFNSRVRGNGTYSLAFRDR